MDNTFIDRDYPKSEFIENKIKEQLHERLRSSESYSLEEINDIKLLSTKLFPENFIIPKDICRRLRPLCSLSQTNLKNFDNIQSHRKIIGPIIVFIKRIIFNILKTTLKDSFKGIEQFQSWSVDAYAKEAYARYQLEQKL